MFRVLQWIFALLTLTCLGLAVAGARNAGWLNMDDQAGVPALVKWFAFYLLIATPLFVLSILTAVIPWRKQPFWRRYWNRLPFAAFPWSLIMLLVVNIERWYPAMNGAERMFGVSYPEVEIPSGLDCSGAHEGVFQSGSGRLERHGEEQVQIDPFGMRDEMRIAWIGDCEYILTHKEMTDTLFVKILSADEKGFTCAFSYASRSGEVYKAHYKRLVDAAPL